MPNEEQTRVPGNLTRRLLNRLAESVHAARDRTPSELLLAAEVHLERVRAAHKRDCLVNYRLAAAMLNVMQTVVADWAALPPSSQPWLLGAMNYFVEYDDEEPDLKSPIGFEDDAEVLNACLRLAGRDGLCLNTEDYDDV
ncbi:MAG: hypothetical protein FJ276_02255 [Planctomycetes bacterium]|nr:hypothetical protein [Planctomycetota bacterium]